MKTCGELAGLIEETQALGWGSGTPEGCVTGVLEPLGLGERGVHVKASGSLLPASASHAAALLTQQFAVALISIFPGWVLPSPAESLVSPAAEEATWVICALLPPEVTSGASLTVYRGLWMELGPGGGRDNRDRAV